MDLTTEEIREFEAKIEEAKRGACNPSWLRIYDALLVSLDHLDARLALCTVNEKIETTDN